MRTMGLLGGMSWESTIEYYRIVNELVRERLGGLSSARCLLHSFDFSEIGELQAEGHWDDLRDMMVDAAVGLRDAGADFIVICTNTMHALADDVEDGAGVPVLHIADATAERVKADGVTRVALLGTRFTMEGDFYAKRLGERHGLEVIVPDVEGREEVHRVIYEELCAGKVIPESRERLKGIISTLEARGAEGVVLGCTEIPLLIGQGDVDIKVYDTTEIHASAAVMEAMR